MDRKALLLYLQNVRDLEVAKNIVGNDYNRDKTLFEKRINEKQSGIQRTIGVPEFQWKQRGFCFVMGIIGLIGTTVYTVMIIKAIMDDSSLSSFLMIPLCWYPICGVLLHFSDPGSKNKQEERYKKEVAEIQKKNNGIERNNKTIKNEVYKIQKEWDSKATWYHNEYGKITAILTEFYNMNIIPVQYRNSSAAIYLYDYMSTSQESFQMALLSNQIEDGIRRIEEKLDSISSLICEQIYETRCLRAENRQYHDEIISQNSRMLQRLSTIESTAEETAEYARLASNYSKANAFFSLASYLDRKQ